MRWLAALALLAACTVSAQIPQGCHQYQREITRSAWRTLGPDAPVAMFGAQTQQESGCRADAVSRVGALGLTQFMPATARDMARRFPECSPANELNANWSIRCSHLYMRSLHRDTRPMGDEPLSDCAAWWIALQRYNGGGWVTWDRVAAQRAGADPDDPMAFANYRGVNPRTGRQRTPGNHHENTDYPRRIMLRLMPRYASWGGVIPCP